MAKYALVREFVAGSLVGIRHESITSVQMPLGRIGDYTVISCDEVTA